MSVKISLLIYGVDNQYLTATEKHVLSRLALFGGDDGRKIFPSYARLAKETGFNKRAIIRIVKRLMNKGFLAKKKRKKGREYNSNYYTINLETLKSYQNLDTSTIEEGGSDLASSPSGSQSLPSGIESPPLVTDGHYPSGTGSPKSNLKVNKKVNTHSQVDFAGSVDGVCLSSLSQKEFQAKELGFQDLCHLWPKKEGLEAAQKIYSQIVPEEISSDRLFDAAKTKIESLNSQYLNESERVRYCPQLNNWLREKRYLDQPHISKQMSHVQPSPREMRTIAAMERSAATVRQLMKQ